ncbi:hypothetical protein JCM10450v2_005352 [Rhodotorula kratochvilovae]
MASMTTTATSGKRKKQPKSCLLVRLPEPILRRIFVGHVVDNPSCLRLCRALYPIALEAVYRQVNLRSCEQMQRFAWTLRRNPECGRLVLDLSLQNKRITKENPRPTEWHATAGDAGAAQLLHFEASYTCIVVGVGLLKDIVRRLVNLDALGITGSALFSPVPCRSFLEESPYPRLKLLVLFRTAAIVEDVLPDTLGHNVALIPSLKTFLLDGLSAGMPTDLLNLSPTSSIALRSLRLESFCLMRGPLLLSEIRSVLQALAIGTKSVILEAWFAYPRILHDVALLPPSVERLELAFGPGRCVDAAEAASPSHAHAEQMLELALKHGPPLQPLKLVAVPWYFPILADLRLEGDIIAPETFDVLLSLPSLLTLTLGTHTRFAAPPLIAFLRANDTLKTLYLHVCVCVPTAKRTSSSRKTRRVPAPRPVWREGFGAADAHAIVRACNEERIAVGGTFVCAARVVPSERPHECRGWCK